jgi:pyruvate,orthophosphate dikinase
MILADDEAGRRKALEKIQPMQKKDFAELFQIMDGLPVTIRLLDPPLHEFLPHTPEDMKAVAEASGVGEEKLYKRTKELSETNPMLGWRGCRLGVTFPEIYESQLRAIFEAAVEVASAGGYPKPEIMHPLVATREEMAYLTTMTHAIAKEVFAAKGKEIAYMVGTMIELPRAALLADKLAETAEFFSFGTNDLTQTTYGISRDDSGRFLNPYIEKGIFEKDPFVSLDQDGVGALIKIAAEKGKKQRPDIKMGICGEHGGDPASIAFCHGAGLAYVSCSPYRVPVARLAAAQAAIAAKG